MMPEVAPKKDHNHIAYFLGGHGVMLYKEKQGLYKENWIFTPIFNFFAVIVTFLPR